MPLLAYNKTLAALTWAGIASPIPAQAPASGTLGVRAFQPVDVTREFKARAGGDLTAIQALVDAGSVEFEWTGTEEFAAGFTTSSRVAAPLSANVAVGLPEIIRTLVPSGANGDVDTTLPVGHKIRVLDAGVVLKGAGTAGSLLTLKSTANPISNAIDVSAGADQAVFRPSTIDDAFFDVPGGGILRWTKASTGGDFPGAECWALVVRLP